MKGLSATNIGKHEKLFGTISQVKLQNFQPFLKERKKR